MTAKTPRMPNDIRDFHKTFIEIAQYLIVLEPELLKWYDFKNYECDDYPHDRQKYQYHRLVLEQLEHCNAIRTDDIEHCYDLRLLKSFGGTEGDEGVPYYYIFKFKGKLYKLSGHYSSYDDSPLYWNDLHQVVEKERTITVYERLDGQVDYDIILTYND